VCDVEISCTAQAECSAFAVGEITNTVGHVMSEIPQVSERIMLG